MTKDVDTGVVGKNQFPSAVKQSWESESGSETRGYFAAVLGILNRWIEPAMKQGEFRDGCHTNRRPEPFDSGSIAVLNSFHYSTHKALKGAMR